MNARARCCTALVGLMAAIVACVGRAEQQVWLVSTRCASRCPTERSALRDIRYWRLQGTCEWQPTDETAFLESTEANGPTVFFLHGNDDNLADSINDAWYLYPALKCAAGKRSFRYVIWSWPSDRVSRRARTDVQVKAAYSDADSCYFAWQLHRLPGQSPVSMIGYSFGARIITGALHLEAGGEFDCCKLISSDPDPQPRRPMRAMLVAAAMDAGWLSTCNCHGRALLQADKVLVTVNRCDRALRWYPRLYGRRGPQALGFVGPCGPFQGGRLEVLDVTCAVGRNHQWPAYACLSSLRARLREYAFLDGDDGSL